MPMRRQQPFDGARPIAFQPPLGEHEVYFVPHSETHTPPRFIGKVLRRVDVRGACRCRGLADVLTLSRASFV
jgi:saccharopine dehydrogenase-like NADP-dependent oxidoreductase